MGLLEQSQQGGGMTPQLAEAAAQAGAPAPGAEAQPAGNPLQGAPAPAPAGPAPGGPAGPPPGAGAPPPAPGGPAPAPAQATRQVDPGAAAVPGQLPKGFEEEDASPEEQKEYGRVMQAVAQILYANDQIANSIVDQIDPNDKVSSTSKVSMLLIQQLDSKVNMNEVVVPEVTKEVTGRIMELAEARHGIQYGEREGQVIIGSVWEGVQQMFGMEQEEAQAMLTELGGDGLADLKQQYEGMLNG